MPRPLMYLCLVAISCATAGKTSLQAETKDSVPASSREIFAKNTSGFPEGADKEFPQFKEFVSEAFKVMVWSKDFSRGNALAVEIEITNSNLCKIGNPPINLKMDDRDVVLREGAGVYYALFANSPDSRKKKNSITIFCNGKDGVKISESIPIVQKIYPVSVSKLDVKNFSDKSEPMTKETIEFIEKSQQKKLKAFISANENLMSGYFRYPRDEHKITSPFYIKRVYERYKVFKGKKKKLKGRESYHGGTDLKGQEGAPIFAIADGVVNLAERLFYEGNIVILDHGHGVLSGYMHQSELLVKQGDRVKAGQQIGKSGMTGMVTGPHLHIFLSVNGVKADALSLINLPIRMKIN